ncbi:LysR family transcriptional regulator [Halochromatium sp.]
MDRIESLRVYLRVVDCLSFTRAANQLQMPRSTVSTSVRDLEERLGVRLLTRSTRSVAPTQDGAAFYERCTRLLNDYDELETLFQASTQPLSGRLSVSVPGRMGRLIFAPALPKLLEQYPGLEVELSSTDREVDLIQDGIDCAIRVGDITGSSLVARPLGMLEMANCAAPAYLERHGTPQSIGELENHFAVRYASPTNARVEYWDVETPDGVQEMPLRSRVTANHAEALIACCLAGLGMIQVPAYDVRDDIRNGTLIEVLPKARAPAMPINIVYPHRRHLSHRLRVFMDWAEDVLRKAIS